MMQYDLHFFFFFVLSLIMLAKQEPENWHALVIQI